MAACIDAVQSFGTIEGYEKDFRSWEGDYGVLDWWWRGRERRLRHLG